MTQHDRLAGAEAALSAAEQWIEGIRGAAETARDAFLPGESRATEQSYVDGALDALRVLAAEEFGRLEADAASLPGVAAIGVLEARPGAMEFEILRAPRAAWAPLARSLDPGEAVAEGGPVTLRLTGPCGDVVVPLAEGARSTELRAVVSATRERTGLCAEEGLLRTLRCGTEAFLRVEQIGGPGVFTGGLGESRGDDAEISFEGGRIRGLGASVFVCTAGFRGRVDLDPSVAKTGRVRFTVRGSGPWELSAEGVVLGIPSLDPADLGAPVVSAGGIAWGGPLSSLRTAAGSDLYARPENAAIIASGALRRVTEAREAVLDRLVQEGHRALRVLEELDGFSSLARAS